MTYDDMDLVAAADIAREHGVSRRRAHSWTHRPDFPRPLGRVATKSKVWERAIVNAYLSEKGLIQCPAV